LVGHAAAISAGEWITASGNWINDRTHGQQFKPRFLKTSTPTSVEGIEKYLASGMIRGIGPVYAKKLLRAFGDKVFDVIEAEPQRLREVDGIGLVRAGRITAAWAEQKAVREIMVFLHSHGVGTARAVRIYKTYGGDAVQVMSENPYRLARDIRGIGFKTADAIAIKLGVDKTALVRVRAGISYALTEAMDEGHCGLPTDDLVPLAEKLLEVPQELVRTALDLELADGAVIADMVGDKPCVFLAGPLPGGARHRGAAAAAWDRHAALALDRSGKGDPLDRAAHPPGLRRKPEIGGRAGAHLQGAGDHRRPGRRQDDPRQCHPAHSLGKGDKAAAVRSHRTCGQAHERGHRLRGQDHPPLLEVDPRTGGFRRDSRNPLDCDLLVIDETSMVDVLLMHALLKAMPNTAALLVVGDVDQLPSVGPGQVLADMIASGVLPVVRLIEVFRQAAKSQIIVNAQRVNEGMFPDLRMSSRAWPRSLESRDGGASVSCDHHRRAVEFVMKADQDRAGLERFVHRHLIDRRMGEERVIQVSVIGKPIFDARKPIVAEHHVEAAAERPSAPCCRHGLAMRHRAR
jgi:exodeoxyribonuclease V alpha subunit